MTFLRVFLLFLLTLAPVLTPGRALAEQSLDYDSISVTARLITAQNAIEPEQTTLSAALSLDLKDGWKVYWRTPGQAGLPPQMIWQGSENLANVEFQWPAPERFRAFDIENYGYSDSVTFPLLMTLARAGEPTSLQAQVNLLVCSDVCIPETFSLNLDLGKAVAMDTVDNSGAIDMDNALRIAEAAARVPSLNDDSQVRLVAVNVDEANYRFIAEFAADAPMQNPDVFAELGISTFDPPEFNFSDDRRRLVAVFPRLKEDGVISDLRFTLVDETVSASFDAGEKITHAPILTGTGTAIAWMILLAFIGGLILNVMPCVLPVLTIKLSSALAARDKPLSYIRVSFIASALGVMAFMWLLAGGLVALKALGYSIGWGIQFQNPYFLAFLIVVLIGFAANMFGLFEINLPQTMNAQMTRNPRAGLVGDFATGAFAALLATPCSAPFLGTAVAFALGGSVGDVMIIFTALGAGLALPYVLIAVAPQVVKLLPRPGAWMVWVRAGLGVLLLLTALWLGSVLVAVHSLAVALGIAVLTVLGLALILYNRKTRTRMLGAVPLILALILPAFLAVDRLSAPNYTDSANDKTALQWQVFAYEDIATLVKDEQVVFVDVTADWCLTCQANKRLVLGQEQVKTALMGEDITMLRADWTRPDPDILAYLQTYNRAGIPFNIVYGRGAPQGIILSEVLSAEAVLSALERARGQ